jgi:DNA polymerase-3 subunit gamma/tau
MSYVVLARRWRPQLFEDVIGQEHITQTLIRAVETERVGHAYLFTGPRGIGKTSTARILAKALNCHKGPGPKPCNKCPSCKEISEGMSIDVLEIDGASNRGIDEIRELRANVKFAPARDRLKIYIIDEVHMLTPEAFNALLKTLEEPPEHVKFIFATTAPHKIPLTIISRCQRFNFKRISIPDTTERLKKVLKAEKMKATEDALFVIARNASGSMRDAESVLDQLISFSEGEIKAEDVDSLLGLVDQETFLSLGKTIIEDDTVSALTVLDRIINEGKDIEQFVRSWQQYWRDVLMMKMDSAKLVELPEPSQKQLAEQADQLSEDDIFRIMEILSRTAQVIRRSASSRIPVEIAIAELTHPISSPKTEAPAPEKPPVKETPRKPVSQAVETAAPVQESAQPAPESAQPEPDAAVAAAISLDEVVTKWPLVLKNVKKEKIMTSAFLIEGKPIHVDNRKIAVAFGEDFTFHKDSCKRKENKTLIEKALQEVFNSKFKLHCVSEHTPEEAGVKEEKSKYPTDREKAAEIISKDPVVKKTMEIFGVKILDIKEEEHSQ